MELCHKICDEIGSYKRAIVIVSWKSFCLLFTAQKCMVLENILHFYIPIITYKMSFGHNRRSFDAPAYFIQTSLDFK
jgi:hypothetical protein